MSGRGTQFVLRLAISDVFLKVQISQKFIPTLAKSFTSPKTSLNNEKYPPLSPLPYFCVHSIY
jgi:hypothetical protein